MSLIRPSLYYLPPQEPTDSLPFLCSCRPRGYTFTLALIPGFGDPFILATAIDFWKNQLSDESENDPIPNEGRLLVYPQTVYQVHLGQAGDRRLTYYHANLALDTLKVHFYAIREESYVALAEVRIWAGAVLEGRVTLIARRRLKGIVCDDNEVGIGIGDGGRIKEVARN